MRLWAGMNSTARQMSSSRGLGRCVLISLHIPVTFLLQGEFSGGSVGLGVYQESPLGVWGTQKSQQEPIRLMSQHMDVQMFQQQWMEAQAMGDIYKNGCKNYCVCVYVCVCVCMYMYVCVCMCVC